eukprot:TRINITY_DN968_c0_g1_i2.p1 TRINITY_DN968_c0_g1~~TRINITY_DN968_c0_g1_i2.p1  ORF type:complete len:180 (-),score=65.39 TRINITY_DN968_c0_g1_i2:445-984(-)
MPRTLLPPPENLGNNDNNDENRFDKEALAWESNPFIKAVTEKTANQILLEFEDVAEKLNKPIEQFNCMEFGCGTGLLSTYFAEKVNKIIGIDASKGMVEQFNKKREKYPNIKGIEMMLVNECQLEEQNVEVTKFDVIYSQLTAHHIDELPPIMKLLRTYLVPGGKLIVVDFENTGKTDF